MRFSNNIYSNFVKFLLMIEAGYGLNSSLGFLIALQGGAIVGTLIIARLCDKYGSKKMLVPMYASGAIALTLLGFGGNTFVIYRYCEKKAHYGAVAPS